MQKKEMLRRKFRVLLATGASGSAGMVLLGATTAVVIIGLVLLGLLILMSAVVFSSRDEPSKRLLKLIKALWR